MTGNGDKPKFYGRRKGRPLRQGQAGLLDTALPALSLPVGVPPYDPATLFNPPPERVWLEVGFGAGEHLAGLAARYPETGFIGCEPFINGVARLVRTVEEKKLRNIRILADDARLLFDGLEPGSIDRIFVLFPDPWPKKRHWRRRFLGPDNIPHLARLLRPGGILRVATDHAGYLAWILFHMNRSGLFDWTAERADDWRLRPDDRPPTRYEAKSLAGPPSYLDFRRR